jgi:endonuclease-3
LATTTLESERIRANEIIALLRANLTIRNEDFASVLIARESGDSFRVLVVTVLSQSCTDIAALRAYRNLDKSIGVSVQELAQADVRRIQSAIRVAGLHRQKARALKQMALLVSERYVGNLDAALDGPLEEARGRLQELPKIGSKTADVLLSVWGRPTISVDTHVDRISKRLGLTPHEAKYEEVRSGLMSLFREEDYRSIPLLFMAHGRRFCKSVRPLCPICPVGGLCPYRRKTRRLRRSASV